MLKPDDFYRALREVELTMVESLVKKALAEGHSAPEVLNGGLIAGMSIVGREFKARELWVPDVLLAARNMQRGIEILKPLFSEEGRDSKGKIILGTVKGDIHDIGKNLVAIMMTGSGFEVIDLGVDVAPEKFLAAAKEHKPQLIGLSALLTTTMLDGQGSRGDKRELLGCQTIRDGRRSSGDRSLRPGDRGRRIRRGRRLGGGNGDETPF
jgi:5-methyltetrahydrofolate--homocysteine methyltransferase